MRRHAASMRVRAQPRLTYGEHPGAAQSIGHPPEAEGGVGAHMNLRPRPVASRVECRQATVCDAEIGSLSSAAWHAACHDGRMRRHAASMRVRAQPRLTYGEHPGAAQSIGHPPEAEGGVGAHMNLRPRPVASRVECRQATVCDAEIEMYPSEGESVRPWNAGHFFRSETPPISL